MSSLVPEKRLDKNNRLVTRHVKSSDSDAPPVPLPAPTITPARASREALLKLREEVTEAIEDHDEKELLTTYAHYHFMQGVGYLDEKTALLMKEVVTTPRMSALCIHLLTDYWDRMTSIREVLHYRDAIEYTQDDTGYNISDECLGFVRGIHEMREFENCEDLSALPEDKQRQVSALMRVGYAVYKSLGPTHPALSDASKFSIGSQYPLRIIDQSLVKVIMENPTSDEMMVSLIESHKNADPLFLEESISAATPSLVNGVL